MVDLNEDQRRAADDALLELLLPATGEHYRITADGRYLVTVPGREDQESPPISRYEKGQPKLSPAALDRLRASLNEVRFFSLPARLPSAEVSDDVRIPNSGDMIRPTTVVFRAHDGPRQAEVIIEADVRAPSTLGPLEPLYRTLDQEALGGWMNE